MLDMGELLLKTTVDIIDDCWSGLINKMFLLLIRCVGGQLEWMTSTSGARQQQQQTDSRPPYHQHHVWTLCGPNERYSPPTLFFSDDDVSTALLVLKLVPPGPPSSPFHLYNDNQTVRYNLVTAAWQGSHCRPPARSSLSAQPRVVLLLFIAFVHRPCNG